MAPEPQATEPGHRGTELLGSSFSFRWVGRGAKCYRLAFICMQYSITLWCKIGKAVAENIVRPD